MIAAIVAGVREAAPEAGGLIAVALFLALCVRAGAR